MNDKIQSYGQLRTIGATPNQIRRIVKKESRRLGGIGILSGVLPGVGGGLLLFPKGFHGTYYGMAVILTAVVCWRMVLTRSPEQAARLFFPDGDYRIHLSSEQPEEEIMAAGNPLDEELLQEILSVDGVTDVLVTRRSLHAKFGTSESTEAGMCDMLTDSNRMNVEATLVSGAMPADAHSILLGTNYQKHHADMDVGVAMELILGQETVTVTISGLFDVAKTANGHGALAMDSTALFAFAPGAAAFHGSLCGSQ